MYEKELATQRAQIAQRKSDGVDPYEIKQLENAAQETEQVLPDSIRRLETALEHLKDFVRVSDSLLWSIGAHLHT